MSPRPVVRRWEKPVGDYVKVNCDAAFDTETWNGGWDCVLHDSDGDVVEARRGRNSSTYDFSAVTHLAEELRSFLSLNFISRVV